MSILTGIILARNDDGTYKMQPTHTTTPYDRVPGIDGANYGVGQEVPYALIGGDTQVGRDTQRPQILARTQRYCPIQEKDSSWHCPGLDGRRSFGGEMSTVPPGLLGSLAPVPDGGYTLDAGIPHWWDSATGKMDCSMPAAEVAFSKWITKANVTEDPPANYVTDQTFVVDGITHHLPAEETFVRDGICYSATRAWDIHSKGLMWTSPADPDGVIGWTSPILSDDGSMVFSLAEQITKAQAPGFNGCRLQKLWVRAVSASTGALMWRSNISGPAYMTGRNAPMSGRLVYDGTNLYVKYIVVDGLDVSTDLDLDGLTIRKNNVPWAISPGTWTQFVGQFTTRLAKLHVKGMTAATGAPLYEAVLEDTYVDEWSDTLGHYDSDLMMVGDAVAFTYPKVTMPDTVVTELTMEQGPLQMWNYTNYSGGGDEVYLYPAQNLSRMKGYKLEWTYVIITKDDTPKGAPPAWTVSQTVFSTEEYDLSMPYNANPAYHYGHEFLPVYGAELTSIGLIFDPYRAHPRLRSATKNGSFAVIVKDGGPDGSYWDIRAVEAYTGSNGTTDCLWFPANEPSHFFGPSTYHEYPPQYEGAGSWFTYDCPYTEVATIIWDKVAEVAVPRPMVVWTVTKLPNNDPVVTDPQERFLNDNGAAVLGTVMGGTAAGAIVATQVNPENTSETLLCAAFVFNNAVGDLRASEMKNCRGLIGFEGRFYTHSEGKLKRFT